MTNITNSRVIIDIVMWFCWWPPTKEAMGLSGWQPQRLGNPPVATSVFRSHKASDAGNASMSWRALILVARKRYFGVKFCVPLTTSWRHFKNVDGTLRQTSIDYETSVHLFYRFDFDLDVTFAQQLNYQFVYRSEGVNQNGRHDLATYYYNSRLKTIRHSNDPAIRNSEVPITIICRQLRYFYFFQLEPLRKCYKISTIGKTELKLSQTFIQALRNSHHAITIAISFCLKNIRGGVSQVLAEVS